MWGVLSDAASPAQRMTDIRRWPDTGINPHHPWAVVGERAPRDRRPGLSLPGDSATAWQATIVRERPRVCLPWAGSQATRGPPLLGRWCTSDGAECGAIDQVPQQRPQRGREAAQRHTDLRASYVPSHLFLAIRALQLPCQPRDPRGPGSGDTAGDVTGSHAPSAVTVCRHLSPHVVTICR